MSQQNKETEDKPQEKVIEVPVFITDDDVKKMIFLMYNIELSNIKEQVNKLNELIKSALAKE